MLRSWLAGSSSVGTSATSWLLILILGGLLASGLGNGLGILLVLVDCPIEDIVVLEAFTDEEITEDLAKVRVVWLIVETKGAGVVEIDGELIGEATAENLSGGGHLFLHNTVVLLLLCSCLQTLPRKGTTAEVEHNVSEGLHVITTGLLDTQMSIDGSITGSSSQILVLPVWNVEVSLRVTVLLGKSEIDDIDLVTALTNAHEEVVRFDITVDERFGMDVLNSGNELIGKEKNSLQGKLAVAKVEEILQTGSEKVENHGIVITFGAEPADKGNTDTSGKGLVDTSLIFELWVLGFDTLELDGNLFSGDDVRTEVDVTETATANLTANAVFVAHAKIQRIGFRLGSGWIHHSSHLEVELWTLGIELSDTRVDEI